MSDALGVKICNAIEELLEAAFNLTSAHLTLFDGPIEIPTRAIFHNFTPMMLFVLDKVNRLDDVDVVQRRGNTELGSEFLHVLLFCLVLPPLAEFLLDQGALIDV